MNDQLPAMCSKQIPWVDGWSIGWSLMTIHAKVRRKRNSLLTILVYLSVFLLEIKLQSWCNHGAIMAKCRSMARKKKTEFSRALILRQSLAINQLGYLLGKIYIFMLWSSINWDIIKRKKLSTICIATNLGFFGIFWQTNVLYFWEVDLVLLIFISKKWLDIFFGKSFLSLLGIDISFDSKNT